MCFNKKFVFLPKKKIEFLNKIITPETHALNRIFERGWWEAAVLRAHSPFPLCTHNYDVRC